MSTYDDQPRDDATAGTWAAPGSGQLPTPPDAGWAAPGSPAASAEPGQGWAAPAGPPQSPPAAFPAQGGLPTYQGVPAYPGAPAYPPYPGTGGPGGYGALAQDVGIVPLRPLDLGAILGGAFKLLRFNPKAALGFSALAQVLGLVVVLPLVWLLAGRMAGRLSTSLDDSAASATYDDSGQGFIDSMTTNLGQLPSSLVTAVASFLLVVVVSRAVIGEKVSIREAWRHARPSLGRFIGLELLALLVVALAGAVVLGAVIAQLWTAVVVLVLLLVPTVAWVVTRLAFTTTVLVLERAGIVDSLKRSWALTRGSFWRIFGIRLLAAVLIAMIASAVAFPISLLAMGVGFATATGDGDPSTLFIATMLGSTVASALGAALTTPLTVAVDTLLYVDRRMRTEGLDVELARVVAARQVAER